MCLLSIDGLSSQQKKLAVREESGGVHAVCVCTEKSLKFSTYDRKELMLAASRNVERERERVQRFWRHDTKITGEAFGCCRSATLDSDEIESTSETWHTCRWAVVVAVFLAVICIEHTA